jgi:hypothetical protein
VTRRLSIAVVVGDEIVRRGLSAILRDLELAGNVVEFATAAAFDPAGDFDVIVVLDSAGEFPTAVAEKARRLGVKLLVLLDRPEHDLLGVSARPVERPAHGFVRRRGLTSSALGEILGQLAADRAVLPADLARSLVAPRGCPDATGRASHFRASTRPPQGVAPAPGRPPLPPRR